MTDQQKSFELVDFCFLKVEELVLDLHNEYDFAGFEYVAEPGLLKLSWQRNDEFALRPNLPEKAELSYSGISYLAVSAPGKPQADNDHKILEFAGYLHPDDRSITDGLLSSEDARDGYDTIFRFESGLVLKVNARSARCSV